MFAEGQPNRWIRARIRNNIPTDIKTDARWFMNLRVYFARRWMKEQEQQCSSPVNTRPGTPTNENISDAGVIPSVMRAIVRPALQMEGLPVLNILSKLRDEVPGFMYRYIVDRDGQLAGWCYSTPRQRAALEDSGHVLFFDFKAKGTNKYGWPYFSPTVVNSEN